MLQSTGGKENLVYTPGSKLCFPEHDDLSVLCCSLFQAEARTFIHKVEKSKKQPVGENWQPKLGLRVDNFKE